MNFIFPAVIGFCFGFLLQRAGLGHYDRIVNQFRFKDNTMIQFMLGALAAGMAAIAVFRSLGMLSPLSMPDTYLAGNALGGLILGVGMALAGACPGTLIAGIGQGNIDYLVPGFLGFLAGGIGFGYFFRTFLIDIAPLAAYKGISLADATNVSPWLFLICMLGVSLAAARWLK